MICAEPGLVLPPTGRSASIAAAAIWELAATRQRGSTAGMLGAAPPARAAADIDTALAQLAQSIPDARNGPQATETIRLRAALNGLLGAYLEKSINPLAQPMCLIRGQRELSLDAAAVARSLREPRSRLLLLIHDLCLSDLDWYDNDLVSHLAHRLDASQIFLRYNSGLHVSSNGRALAVRLESLMAAWPFPVSRLTLVGHGIGGLVARSAVHAARVGGLAWPRQVDGLVFLGTAHHGAPLGRDGHWVEALLGATPELAAFRHLARVRLAGVSDLRHGRLLDEDCPQPVGSARGAEHRVALPLPVGIACHTVAATLGSSSDTLACRMAGDGLVPLDSALGRHRQAERRLAFAPGRTCLALDTSHRGLLASAKVFRWIGRGLGAR